MKFSQAADIYESIYNSTKNVEVRKLGAIARQAVFSDYEIRKVAFDTRRVNQETERNPRGNLQYYHRSEPFIDNELADKIASLMKVKTATDLLKERYGREPEWFDSYARILASAVDRALRTEQKDADFYKAQFNYLDELLYVRYRLAKEDLKTMNEQEMERVILSRDEKLFLKHIYGTQRVSDIQVKSEPDPLIDRLLSGIKATGDNRDVERSVMITVRDKINDLAKTSDIKE